MRYILQLSFHTYLHDEEFFCLLLRLANLREPIKGRLAPKKIANSSVGHMHFQFSSHTPPIHSC